MGMEEDLSHNAPGVNSQLSKGKHQLHPNQELAHVTIQPDLRMWDSDNAHTFWANGEH